MEWADVYIGLRGAHNPHEFEGIRTEKIAARKKVLGEIARLRTDRTRWVLVRVPNESFAQQAGVNLDRIMAFFFNATLRDWDVESRAYQKLQMLFQAAEIVRIRGEGTDLRFSTKGRIYAVEDGHINMPGGEIFTAPVDESAEGEIFFETPGVYAGQLINGIRLTFSKGEVVNASAETNETLLHQLLDMDEGARRIGEFGVGTNHGIDFISNDILFDEKIYGTVHIALGRAYSECRGINRSALHWDIIKDLRQTGEIYLDNQQVFKAGRFLRIHLESDYYFQPVSAKTFWSEIYEVYVDSGVAVCVGRRIS